MTAEPTEPTEPGDSGDSGEADLSYADAVDELDRLLAGLEQDDADIDELAANVRRAALLIRVCRARLERAKVDVEQIVADLDAAD